MLKPQWASQERQEPVSITTIFTVDLDPFMGTRVLTLAHSGDYSIAKMLNRRNQFFPIPLQLVAH